MRGERAGRSLNLPHAVAHSVASHSSSRVAAATLFLATLEPLCVVLRNKFDGKFVKFSERVRTTSAMCAITADQIVTI